VRSLNASNNIGNTTASESPKPPAKGKEPWKNKPKSPFGGGEGAGTNGPVQTKAMEKEQILDKLTTVQVQDYVSFIPA
jgi:hypothetical protein